MSQNEIRSTSSIPVALLFAGYMIPYDNLGKTYAFDVLQVPWKPVEMRQLLGRLIECECWDEEKILTQPPELIFDTDLELLARGKGFRIWLVTDGEFVRLVTALLKDGLGSLSGEEEACFTGCVDRIGAGPATLEIRLSTADLKSVDFANIEQQVKALVANFAQAIC